jgi:hypothetical protein
MMKLFCSCYMLNSRSSGGSSFRKGSLNFLPVELKGGTPGSMGSGVLYFDMLYYFYLMEFNPERELHFPFEAQKHLTTWIKLHNTAKEPLYFKVPPQRCSSRSPRPTGSRSSPTWARSSLARM